VSSEAGGLVGVKMPPVRARRAFALAILAAAGTAFGAPSVEGEYDTPLGRVRVASSGAGYRGTLVAPARGAASSLRPGDEVLRATLLDDSLAGQLRLGLAGKQCRDREVWANVVLLVADGRLTGAASLARAGCAAPALGRRGSVTFRRVPSGSTARATARGTPGPAAPPSRREQARALLRDGAAHLSEGGFEPARRRFHEAIAIDPALPEAYNGVGVTYRMRDDLPAALEWYKRALAVDPDFGDAYYNIACVYALQGKPGLALRYLQVSALNGYETAATIQDDPDLASLRDDPAYRALVSGAPGTPAR